ncbi:MipA/OmpV family protein [Rheinheimera sp. 1928-s]|uniref:MipA/OmpV family protein n=1 Tax=Rheinheimera sp. 1928-s TaxID=3033803 RepID=UPI002635BA35|nr:MipA/OmpV family protein [Rheinheimera sp. 1928-s]MDF3125976.1 MipA/OmpV family protein [Rheinheimera sp. 1928-s]
MFVCRYFSAAVLAVAALCSAKVAAQQAAHQGFLYGVGIGVNQEIYNDFSSRTIPLPILGYQGERLSVYGPFISYKLLELENISFSAKLAPRFAGFDGSDSPVFTNMAERKDSLDGGLGVQLRQRGWLLEADTVFDLLGNSNGSESKLTVSYSYLATVVIIEPKLSVSYFDTKLVNYYYGVRPEEVTAQRPAYKADGSVNYNAGFSLSTPLFFDGMTKLGLEHHWYGNSVSNSPLTDRNRGWSASLYWFTLF